MRCPLNSIESSKGTTVEITRIKQKFPEAIQILLKSIKHKLKLHLNLKLVVKVILKLGSKLELKPARKPDLKLGWLLGCFRPSYSEFGRPGRILVVLGRFGKYHVLPCYPLT
jgi:hypothetical protein